MRLFYRLGEKLYEKIERNGRSNFLKKQPSYDMKNLYPGKNAEEMLRSYYINKISTVICVLILGLVFAVLSFTKGYTDSMIVDQKYIPRNDYGEGSIQADVSVGFEDGSKEEIVVSIGERRFKEEELERLYEQAKEQVGVHIFSEGDSVNGVTDNLYLPSSLEGFPFQIQWESGDYALVDYDGTVYNEGLSENGQIVNLTALFTYYEFKREYVFPVHVLPPILSEEQLREKALKESLEQSESISIHEENYVLPASVDGKSVTWEEKRDKSWMLILLLAGMAAVMVYRMKDYELHKQVLLKQEEI